MIDFVFMGVLAGLICFTVLAGLDRKNFVWPCLAVLFAAMCTVGVINVESGYSMLYENKVDNSIRVVSGVRSYDGASPLAIVFLGIIIMMIVVALERAFLGGGGER
jgi:hypothetical protein